jgi:hypothetical protein
MWLEQSLAQRIAIEDLCFRAFRRYERLYSVPHWAYLRMASFGLSGVPYVAS